ncbi:MAG: hypothetical protein JXR97_07945 [Planctomycetes bacterium]|nr:hypothetical protein [Planctomycetota bacterium]
MTIASEKHKIYRSLANKVLRILSVILVSLISLFSLLTVQDIMWRGASGADGARSSSEETFLRSIEELASEVGVEKLAPGGLPVPVATAEYFPRVKKGQYGIYFQAVYESSFPSRQISAFYAWHLLRSGWKVDSRAAKALSEATNAVSLIFIKGNMSLNLTIYPDGKREGGCDFLISLISRMPQVPVGSVNK